MRRDPFFHVSAHAVLLRYFLHVSMCTFDMTAAVGLAYHGDYGAVTQHHYHCLFSQDFFSKTIYARTTRLREMLIL